MTAAHVGPVLAYAGPGFRYEPQLRVVPVQHPTDRRWIGVVGDGQFVHPGRVVGRRAGVFGCGRGRQDGGRRGWFFHNFAGASSPFSPAVPASAAVSAASSVWYLVSSSSSHPPSQPKVRATAPSRAWPRSSATRPRSPRSPMIARASAAISSARSAPAWRHRSSGVTSAAAGGGSTAVVAGGAVVSAGGGSGAAASPLPHAAAVSAQAAASGAPVRRRVRVVIGVSPGRGRFSTG